MSLSVIPRVLSGRHVRLEPLTSDHIPGLFEAGQHARDWQYLPRPCLDSLEDTASWVEQALQLQAQGLHFPYAQVDPHSGEVMGSTRYLNVRPRDRGLEIGYTWLAPQWQRTPVNTEAKFLLLRHAIEELGAIRVELKTDARNRRSQQAIERIGGIREGVFRRHMLAQNGHIRDSVYYSITDLDWPQVGERLQRMLSADAEEVAK